MKKTLSPLRAALMIGVFLLCHVSAVSGAIDGGSSWWEAYDLSMQVGANAAYYRSKGPAGSYRHQHDQYYSNFNFTFENNHNPYNLSRGYVSGVFNDSPYRADRNGLLVERMNLHQENGEYGLPWRLDLGDYHAFTTARTMQRPVKGAQVELQPGKLRSADTSLLFFSGGVAQDYTNIQYNEDLYQGASFLMAWPESRLSLNYTHNSQEPGSGFGTSRPAMHQHVYGAAFHRKGQIGGQNLEMDVEINRFEGDRLEKTEKDRTEGMGYFFYLRGRSAASPLSYSYRFEDYEQSYLPRGASIASGRRSHELRGTLRAGQATSIALRQQFFQDAAGKPEEADTLVSGVNVSTSFSGFQGKRMNLALDMFRQTYDAPAAESETHALSSTFSTPLPAAMTLRLNGGFQDLNVRQGGAGDRELFQYGLDVSRSLAFAEIAASLSLGYQFVNLRQQGQGSRDSGVNLAASLSREAHRFRCSYRHLAQNRDTGLVDNTSNVFSAAYEYVYHQHQFRLEMENSQRHPENSPSSRDTRFMLVWNFTLDRPASGISRRFEELPVSAPEKKTEQVQLLDGNSLEGLFPGSDFDRVLEALAGRGILGGVQEGRFRIFETLWFEEISQRQRLVLERTGSRLTRAGILIDLDAVGEPESFEHLYERLRSVLIRRYGAPISQEKGVFEPGMADELRAGRFLRISDWHTPAGVIRLGIPRRMDGRIRIEVVYASSFPLSAIMGWGFEDIQ